MRRFGAVAIALALGLSACAVSRESGDVISGPGEDELGLEEVEAPDEADEGSAPDEDPVEAQPTTTLAPLTTLPPTTGPPDEVAMSADFDGVSWEITHGELNEVVVPTQENEEFVALVFGGLQPPGFDVGVLTEHFVARAVQVELDELGAAVSDQDREDTRVQLLLQLEQNLFAGQPNAGDSALQMYEDVPYLPFLVDLQAKQDALTNALSESAAPGEGNPCVSHILVEAEDEADAILVELQGGADFATLAQERSTGPSGPVGGVLGCNPAATYVPEFAAALESAEIGQFIGPVQTSFGWHVLLVDRYEVDGRLLAGERIEERMSSASVEVDGRIGSWDDQQLVVVAPPP